MGRGGRLGWLLAGVLTGLGSLALIGQPVVAGALAPVASRQLSGAQAASPPPTRHFRSEPDLHPPVVRMASDPDTGSGDIFLSPDHGNGGGLMILGAEGRLVWFDSLGPRVLTSDLTIQSYQGQPVLTWYDQYSGEDVITNRSYQTVAVVKAADGDGTGFHDFVINPDGTAWVLATRDVHANLTSVGGESNGQLRDEFIQKVNIKTGRLLWQWDCYGHIPLKASHAPVPEGGALWDAFHLNSFQELPDGNLLVSARNTWSVYEVSTKTGRILWTLGGKYNQFKLGPGTQFEWQHDAHRIGNTLTLFDDAAGPTEQDEEQSSAKELALNVTAKRVTLIHRYTHTPPLLSSSQGSVQILSNGDVFVGWGEEPDFSEYRPDGQQIFNGSFALGTWSYRAFRFPWTGHPITPPDLAATRASNGRTNVWASWNGATNVTSWRVLGGPSASTLHTLTTHPDRHFETQITLKTQPAYVEVQGMGARGQVLPHGTSSVVAAG